MSEHGAKKLKKKPHQWEEAGSEFYQERYNGELETRNKKTCPITTLLPSKQFRIGTARKSNESSKVKLWQSTISATQKKYIKVDNSSQIPDLSEVCTDEESIWEEILQIKLLAINMTQKKELLVNLRKTTKLRLQGLNHIRWQRRKIWHQFKEATMKLVSSMELWENSLKCIESNYGTGVLAFFLFIRWIFFLNCILFLIMLTMIILPFLILNGFQNETCDLLISKKLSGCKTSDIGFEMSNFFNYLSNMKCTLFFYSAYTMNQNSTISSNHEFMRHFNTFDLPFAFITAFISCFLTSFIFIAKTAVREFKEKLIFCKTKLYPYSCIIFGSWDYCIRNKKAAIVKQKAIANELDHNLNSTKMYFEKYSRSKQYIFELIILRIIINIAIVIMILMSTTFLYFIFENDSTFKAENNATFINSVCSRDVQSTFNQEWFSFEIIFSKSMFLLLNFYPYVLLATSNIILPSIFSFLCKFEKYSQIFVIKINLWRNIFVRSSSLGVFLLRIYKIARSKDIKNRNCWEMYVGEVFYKIIIADFFCQCLVIFCINFPRRLLCNNGKNKIISRLGNQNFELWNHVLDIIYLQAICWLGFFYAPFLPFLTALFMFLIFYLKKFQCLFNSRPSKVLCGASKSNSLFMLVLLCTFCATAGPLCYALTEFKTSSLCGPFVEFESVWDCPTKALNLAPPIMRSIIIFVTAPKFVISLFFILCLFIYYYYIKSDANKQMVDVLRNQLVLEGHDKQFLLTRLSYFFKHQNQSQNLELNDLN